MAFQVNALSVARKLSFVRYMYTKLALILCIRILDTSYKTFDKDCESMSEYNS